MLKSDQGPGTRDLQRVAREDRLRTMREVAKNIQSIRGLEVEAQIREIVIKNPPAAESESNGAVENAISMIRGKVRIAKLAPEEKMKSKTDMNPNM